VSAASKPTTAAQLLDFAERLRRMNTECNGLVAPLLTSDLDEKARRGLRVKSGLSQSAEAAFQLAELVANEGLR
jgi:hypothetical protein